MYSLQHLVGIYSSKAIFASALIYSNYTIVVSSWFFFISILILFHFFGWLVCLFFFLVVVVSFSFFSVEFQPLLGV